MPSTINHLPFKILVAGGAGFIGTNLTETLLKQGHQVWVVDNYITGRASNLTHLQSNSNLTVIEADITDSLQLENFSSIEFDQIYHLASPASPPQYQQKPIETLHVNSIGTENLIKLALKHDSKFLYASTSEVYGSPAVHPQPETYWGNVNSFGPRSCYDESKRYGEALCYTYFHHYQLKLKLVRIFNTYGPYMDPEDGRVISNFIVRALQNKPHEIYGDGSFTRSYCYVDDLVRGLMAYMTSEVAGEPINLGNPGEYTILETSEIIRKKIQPNLKVTHLPPVKDDPTQRKPDISKAKNLLNWEPTVALTEGLDSTIAYFRTEIE